MEPDRGGNGARLGPETPHSVEAKTETTVIVASADELRERAREAIRQAFSERPTLTSSASVLERRSGKRLPNGRC